MHRGSILSDATSVLPFCQKKRKDSKGEYLSGPKQGSAEGKHCDLKDCSDSAVSTASRLELSRSAGHLNVLPPRRLNESVRQITDYSGKALSEKMKLKNCSVSAILSAVRPLPYSRCRKLTEEENWDYRIKTKIECE